MRHIAKMFHAILLLVCDTFTCLKILRRREGQISTVALSIPAVLHQTKTWQSWVTILQNWPTVKTQKDPSFCMKDMRSNSCEQVKTYHIKDDPVCMQVMIECPPFATAALQCLCHIKLSPHPHCPTQRICLPCHITTMRIKCNYHLFLTQSNYHMSDW